MLWFYKGFWGCMRSKCLKIIAQDHRKLIFLSWNSLFLSLRYKKRNISQIYFMIFRYELKLRLIKIKKRNVRLTWLRAGLTKICKPPRTPKNHQEPPRTTKNLQEPPEIWWNKGKYCKIKWNYIKLRCPLLFPGWLVCSFNDFQVVLGGSWICLNKNHL